MAQLRPKIVKLAKIIGGASGMLVKIDENAPEYYCMENIVSDDEADIAIAAGLRKERTAGWLAAKVGKTVAEIQPALDNLVYYGVFRRVYSEELGEDTYFMQIFAPGILEMMVNNQPLMAAHPEVGRAFEEYTRLRMQAMGPILPDGYGLMRVIPVESAIEGLPGVTDDERLSYYLNKYDTFSVSPCSCRASRTLLGDGCGHLAEDMCVQMGKGAEHYIRSGRARQISREEAYEIVKRAEENGLMHDIPNIEGSGETSAICNCCACACFGLRAGMMFGARDAIRSNFVAEVDEAKCVACAQCVEVCPGNALKLGQKLCATNDTSAPKYTKITETFNFAKAVNENYRENREDVLPSGTAPCKAACPAHIPVQGYLKLAAQGRYTEALELIKTENPFPAVCGRICNKRCEAECTRGDVDEAVAIDEVKRFIADHDMHEETRFVPKMVNQIGRPYTEKIAVIGAGPAGMSCAYYLAQKGYPVTVFDRNPVPGGMLTLGIPSFRLEKDVLNAEIDILKEMGVEFRCGVEVGKDVTIQQLREEGFKAFYVAVGLQRAAKLNIPGEELIGVQGGLDFLRSVNSGATKELSGDVVVIGGGNAAIDVARAAKRLTGGSVNMYCLEKDEEMPTVPDEKNAGLADGVVINNSWAPKAILGEDGKVTGIELMRCVSVRDASGKFAPVYDENETITVSCSNVLVAIGQRSEYGAVLTGTAAETPDGRLIAHDGVTFQTAEPDVFVGGDCATGPKYTIDAIASGREGAVSIHRYVNVGQTLTIHRNLREFKELDKENVTLPAEKIKKPARSAVVIDKKKVLTMCDDRVTFTEEQIKSEASRCLSCGRSVVDPNKCIGCGICTTKCEFDAIHLKRNRPQNSKMIPAEDKFKAIAPYAAKRQVKIIKKQLSGK